jgi:hypothetical protein
MTMDARDRLEVKKPAYFAGFFARLVAGFAFGVNGFGGVFSIRRRTSSSGAGVGSVRLVMNGSSNG